jgi:hypothetical protein
LGTPKGKSTLGCVKKQSIIQKMNWVTTISQWMLLLQFILTINSCHASLKGGIFEF